jgi:hypothetical protein
MSENKLTPEEKQKKLDSVTELIRKLKRAMQGLSADEDVFSGLLNVKDIRERTRIDTRNVYRHTYMRMLADNGGEEWTIMKDWAVMEEHLFISENGEERREAILMTRAKVEQTSPLTLNLPQIGAQTQEPPKQEEKKKSGFFHRGS